MRKKHSLKFWIIFWVLAVFFLSGWFVYWNIYYGNTNSLDSAVKILPVSQEKKDKLRIANVFFQKFLRKDGEEKVFLILLQNNLELRPGGGFIGSFGILKIKDRRIISFDIHDTGNFDARIPEGIKPPYPIEQALRIKSWKLRDSNYSPDFPTNASQAVNFYYQGGGEEKFDGVIAITTNILESVLATTGPVSLEGYPGVYDKDNAIISLEHQVEQGFLGQGIAAKDRKAIMNELFRAIIRKISALDVSEKIRLVEIFLDDLDRKNIQLYFTEEELQNLANQVGWSGEMEKEWKQDYLAMVDANLGAWKSDYYVKRSAEYTVDLSQEKPRAVLKITYNHTAKQKDWMTNNYFTYLRVYVPENSWLLEWKNVDGPIQYSNEFGKKYFGAIVKTPIGKSKTVELVYDLPASVVNDYRLLIHKQAGIKELPVKIKIKFSDSIEKQWEEVLDRDKIFQK